MDLTKAMMISAAGMKAQGTRMRVTRVNVKGVTYDQSDFGMRYEPGHPGADENGYVKTPNVNGLVEAMDMKQSQRSYEANLNSIEVSKKMVMRTIDLLR